MPIVQSGATTQVSVANLTAGRAVSASSITASTATISGGTINNTTIGGTTAAVGTFTTAQAEAFNGKTSYAGTFVGSGATVTLQDMSVTLTDGTYPQIAFVAVSSGGGIAGALLAVARCGTTYNVSTIINSCTSGSVSFSMSGSNFQITNSTGGGRSFYSRYVRILDLFF